jgi:ectoine hydroxylase-related dioxygenase (phytanoyl-CoA dioxygenase family)
MVEEGYTLVRGALPAELCDRAVDAFRAWCAENHELAEAERDEHGHHTRLYNLHRARPEVERIFSQNAWPLTIQDFCFGYRTALCSSIFFDTGTSQTIHRDAPYFCTVPASFYFGMWVALEDVDAGNGPLVVRPGGHRLEIDAYALAERLRAEGGPIEPLSQDLWVEYQQSVLDACNAADLPWKPIPMQKGDTLIWHPLLPHGGLPMEDPARTRFSIVFHTTPEHVPLYQAEVFFDPNYQASADPRWGYFDVGGRLIADKDPTSFPD